VLAFPAFPASMAVAPALGLLTGALQGLSESDSGGDEAKTGNGEEQKQKLSELKEIAIRQAEEAMDWARRDFREELTMLSRRLDLLSDVLVRVAQLRNAMCAQRD
jgi:hypothetical protein